ncbi:MAG TPA: BPL-N domain-containing protein, partial [Candidatus Acidoferrales bacterium]
FDSFPSTTGASGMTFETDGGGGQGLRLQRADGTISTLHAGTAKHFAGSMAVLEATAARKAERLLDFYQFRKTGMDDVEGEPMKQIVLVEGSDKGRMADFLKLLMDHGIEVHRSGAAFTSQRAHPYVGQASKAAPAQQQFPAGSYVIPLAQSQKRLIKTLLEPEAKLSDEFMKEVSARKERNDQLGRGARKEPYGFYDVTAWSLPLTFGIDAWWTEDRATGLTRVDAPPQITGGVQGGRARYGYVFRYDSNAAAKLLGQLLQEDFRALVARSPVRVGAGDNQETLDRGSILLRTERNPDTLHERIATLARELGVRVRAVNAAWTESGITLGSGRIQDLKRPRVAIAAYEPTNGRGYGSLWFLFERILDYEFTPIRTDRIRSIDLSKYDVIIFPDGSEGGYQEILGAAGVNRMRQWIENGGVFIGIKGGAAFTTRRNVEWTTSRLVGREEPPREGQSAQQGQQAQQPPAEREPEVERTPGALLRAQMNLAHFLTFGYSAEDVVMHNSNYIFKPSRNGTHVVTYAKENAQVSGFIWDDTEKRIGGSPYVIAETLGSGHVILFADDPTFRVVWPRLTRLFLNAVFFAPSLR